MNIIHIILIPIISAFIGWLTNYIAIKSLFKPKKPKRILFFKFQGILPKRKNELAKNLSKIVKEYLFSHEDIFLELEKEEKKTKLKEKLMPVFANKILEKVPSMFRGVAEPIIMQVLEKEFEKIIIDIQNELKNYIETEIDIEKIVFEKISNYEISKLESIIKQVAGKELKHIEYLGAIIGFFVGIIQLLIISFI